MSFNGVHVSSSLPRLIEDPFLDPTNNVSRSCFYEFSLSFVPSYIGETRRNRIYNLVTQTFKCRYFSPIFSIWYVQSFLRIRRNIFHIDISKENPCFYIVQFQRDLRYVQIRSTNMIEMVRNGFTDTDATFEHRLQENSGMLLRCTRINDTRSVELTAV